MVLLNFLSNKPFFEDLICNSQFLSMAFIQVRNPIRKNCYETSHSKSIENQNKQAVKNHKSRCDFFKKNFEVYLNQNRNFYSIYLTGKNRRVLL